MGHSYWSFCSGSRLLRFRRFQLARSKRRAATSMLTLIAYRFAVDSQLPALPYMTRLDAFILTSTLLVFFS
jgi:hypothetical protein